MTASIIKYYCYIHKRKDGTPFYVGKGTYKRAMRLDPYLRNKWHKHIVEKEGKENILIELIPAKSEEDAFKLEIEYIEKYRQLYQLCNIVDGGSGVSGLKHIVSEETKQKMSIAAQGKKHSEESKRKMSEIHKNISNETRQKMSNAQKGKKRSLEAIAKSAEKRKGHKVSEETRKKIGLANTGKKHSEETKQKLSLKHKGKQLSEETKQKMALTRTGENNPFSKLTWKIVKEIREKYNSGNYTQKQLEREYSTKQINKIVNNKIWIE